MKRILLSLHFDGTNYCGWQVQNNGATVQQTLQNALEQTLSHRPGVTGCSRTDSGVHAREFCCHFDTDSNIPAERLPAALNTRLPEDISVFAAREIPSDFHARYSCKSKEYTYEMYISPHRNPFLDKYAYRIKNHNISVALMNEAAKKIPRTADFAAFCAAGSDIKDTVRTVYECRIRQNSDRLTLLVRGDGFLYNMVRIIAGTLLEIGQKNLQSDIIDSIIKSKSRENAGPTAPPHALYLNKIFY